MDGPVEEVRVAIRSSTGEVMYKKFITAPPSTSGLSEQSADTLPAVKEHGASDPSPSIGPISHPVPSDSDTESHQHNDLDHKQEPSGVEKVTDEQPDTQRREDVIPFSAVDRATADDDASLYSFM